MLGLVVISNAQETRVSGTLKVHPWINLPVVESTDVKGGMQSLGIRNLTATPATVLDALVPSFDRTGGMLVSVIDADNSNRTRYFEFTGTAWLEVSLIYYWEAAHAYAIGDYVVYQGNYYVANAAFTSHATTFTNDATKWNNAGGKDGKYTVSELKMDGQTLSKVAPSGATVDPADINKTLATVGFVNAVNVGGGLTFNVDRPVTLSGTNVSGQNLGAGGKTMTEFFQAFFFPAVAATPPSTTFTTATSTFAYTIWKNWPSFTKTDLTFGWSVTNNSYTDNTDDKAITSIKLKSGVTELASATPNGGNQSGNFISITLDNSGGNAITDFSKTYILEVVDAQPNTVSKNIAINLSKALRLTYGAPSLTPSATVYEYSNSNIPLSLGWSITANDENISSISVDEALTGSTSATGSQAVAFKTIANGGAITKAYPLIVTGNLYGAGSTQNSATVSWANRLYRGVITSSVIPSDPSFTFTDAQVRALATETKLGGNWKDANGYDFVCNNQYVVFAYPDDAVIPVVKYWDSNLSTWMAYSASDLKIIDRANFSNQNGYNGTNYKLIFVCVEYPSTTVKLKIQ